VEKDEFTEELHEAFQSQEEIMTDLQKRHRDESGNIVRFKAELCHVKKRHTTTDAENEELISDVHDVLEESDDLKQELAERDVLVEALKGNLHEMEM
jgi:chromosome segregation ATPase